MYHWVSVSFGSIQNCYCFASLDCIGELLDSFAKNFEGAELNNSNSFSFFLVRWFDFTVSCLGQDWSTVDWYLFSFDYLCPFLPLLTWARLLIPHMICWEAHHYFVHYFDGVNTLSMLMRWDDVRSSADCFIYDSLSSLHFRRCWSWNDHCLMPISFFKFFCYKNWIQISNNKSIIHFVFE